ncbi:MAG: ferredoxin reductase [Betaproteobacteria bacterium]
MPDIDSDPLKAQARAVKLSWQSATVVAIEARTRTVKSYFFRFEEPLHFVAGQHMDVRLTAPDGYQAQRSYSIASAPETHDRIELTIERLQDGEVSPFFHDTVVVGDEIELRGPIGGYFDWAVDDGGPVLLIGGGSGVVPLACILRHRAARQSNVPMTLVYSARTTADLIFGDELHALSARGEGFEFTPTFTRELNPAPQLRVGRIDGPLLRAALERLPASPKISFICGKNSFVEAAANALLDLGIAATTIRTERYGG